jgi:hypothetical protein
MSSSTKETELTIYAKITDLAGLEQATSKEEHIQAEIKTDSGRVRVRKTSKDNLIEIVQTIKTKANDSGLIETSVKIDDEFFKAFLSLCPEYMDKHRYIFETTNVSLTTVDNKTIELPKLVYDVDCFTKDDGSYHEWCKIDVEIDAILEYFNEHNLDIKDTALKVKVSHLSFKPIDAFIAENATDEQKQFIDELYSKCFLIPNHSN